MMIRDNATHTHTLPPQAYASDISSNRHTAHINIIQTMNAMKHHQIKSQRQKNVLLGSADRTQSLL